MQFINRTIVLIQFGIIGTTLNLCSQISNPNFLIPTNTPTTGLIGWWDLTSMNSNNLGVTSFTYYTSVSYAADRCGLSITSSFSPNYCHSYMQSLYLGPVGNNSRSLSFWIATSQTANATIFDYGDLSSSGSDFQLAINKGCSGISVDINGAYVTWGNNCISNGLWHHVVAVHNSSVNTSVGSMSLYLDGVLQNSTCANNSTLSLNTASTFPIMIGAAARHPSISISSPCIPSLINRYYGAIDGISLYNRPLTSVEVLQLFTTCPNQISGPAQLCPSTTGTYSMQSIANTTYSWSASPGWSVIASAANFATVQAVSNASSNGTIQVAATGTCGAISVLAYSVSTYAMPNVSLVAYNNTVCSGSSNTVVLSPTVGIINQSYSANNNILSSIFTTPSIGYYAWLNPITQGTLVNTYTTTNGCVAQTSYVQYVWPLPNVTVNSPTICSSQSVTLQANASGASTPYTYTWLPTNTNASTLAQSPTTTSQYTINVKDANNCTATAISTIMVNPIPTLTLSSALAGLCKGLPNTINANGADSFTSNPTLSFVNAGVQSFTSSSTSSSMSSLITTSLFSITGTYTNTGCASTSTLNFSNYPNPIITANSSSAAVCPNSTVALNCTVIPSGSNSFTWLPNSVNSQSFVTTPTASTIYTVQSTTSLGCTGQASVNQIIYTLPTLSILSSSSSICNGLSATLTASNTVGSGSASATTFTWLPGSSTGSTLVVSPTASSIYSVTGTNTNTCKSTTTVLQTVKQNPTVSVSPASPTICFGGTVTLLASASPVGATTYTWNNPTRTGSTFTDNPAVNTTYTLVGTNTLNCIGQAVKTVTVKPKATLSFVTQSITCGNLGFATVTAVSGIGPYTYTWYPSNQTGSAVANLIPGTHTLVDVDLGSGCSYNYTTYFAALIPLTGTVSASASLLCNADANGTANISLSGGSGSQTYTWSSPSATQSIASPTNIIAGTHTINVIDALTFCSVTQTFFVYQPQAFSLSIAPSVNTICLGGTISFSNNALGGTPGYMYAWNGNTISALTQTMSATIAGNYVYTFSIIDFNACAYSKTIAVNFVPNPNVTVSSSTICLLETTTLTATGASNYSWSTGSAMASIVQNPSVTAFYTVVGTALACTTAASSTITVKPLPVMNFTLNNFVCKNDTLKLIANPGNVQYKWMGPSFNSSLQTTYLANFQNSNAGVYSLTITANNGCTNSAQQTVSFIALPVLSALGATVCQFQNAVLNSSSTAGSTIFWAGNSFTSSASNASLSNVQPTASGIYTVVATNSFGCKSSASVNLLVAALHTVSILGTRRLCATGTLTLGGLGAGSFLWTGPAINAANVTTVSAVNVNTLASGIYSLYSTLGPCTAKDTFQVVVDAAPTIFLSTNSPACQNQSLSLSASGGTLYQWMGPATFSATLQNIIIPKVQLNASGFYTVLVTNAKSCTSSAVAQVSVLPEPALIARGDTVCNGSKALITASGGTACLWSGPSGFNSTLYQPTITNVVVPSPLYTVVITGSNACTNSTTVTVTVLSLPNPSITSNAVELCLNQNLVLSGAGGQYYIWSIPGPFNQSYQGKEITVLLNDLRQAGYYTLTAIDEHLCENKTQINISIKDLPSGYVSTNRSEFCAPYCGSFELAQSLNNQQTINTISWSIDNTFISNQKKFTYCFKQAKTFLVRGDITGNNTCQNSILLTVTGYPKPNADFNFSPPYPVENIDEVVFETTNTDIKKFNWNLPNVNGKVITSNSSSFSHRFMEAGNYPVALVLSNKYNCVDTVVKVITVQADNTIFVPNAFTPNADGKNEKFFPVMRSVKEFKMQIFNRWGQLLFQTTDIESSWDGTYRGAECKADIYVWKLFISSRNNEGFYEDKIKQGEVILIRE